MTNQAEAAGSDWPCVGAGGGRESWDASKQREEVDPTTNPAGDERRDEGILNLSIDEDRGRMADREIACNEAGKYGIPSAVLQPWSRCPPRSRVLSHCSSAMSLEGDDENQISNMNLPRLPGYITRWRTHSEIELRSRFPAACRGFGVSTAAGTLYFEAMGLIFRTLREALEPANGAPIHVLCQDIYARLVYKLGGHSHIDFAPPMARSTNPTFGLFLFCAILALSLMPLWAWAEDSPVLAGTIGKDCVEGAKYAGEALGKNLSIADVPTYVTTPPTPVEGPKKVILFFSDVYSPFYENNFILQDHFASQGFHVLGLDYFFGDPIQNQPAGYNQTAWMNKSRKQAEDSIPKWTEAVMNEYGPDAKYSAVGYCFGGPYALEAAATDKFTSAAFAHPAGLTEAHFSNVKKPVLLSLAETDAAFPLTSQRRAIDILTQNKATYHLQVFSGVSHGFATRADPNDANAVWAKEESARSVIGWFTRFAL